MKNGDDDYHDDILQRANEDISVLEKIWYVTTEHTIQLITRNPLSKIRSIDKPYQVCRSVIFSNSLQHPYWSIALTLLIDHILRIL